MLSSVLIALVALLQTYFMVVEMFLWKTPRVRRAFGMTEAFAEQTAVLAKNQGLYNGFLAAGLCWGLVTNNIQIKIFFLLCVLIAGVYGAMTANIRILFVQALPAFLALLCVVI